MATSPNLALRAVREGLLLSQEELARALQRAGASTASKRLVQRWEHGDIACPQAAHRRALERVTRRSAEELGFSVSGADDGGLPTSPAEQPAAPLHSLSGVWLSRYEYPSSGRGATLTGLHYVVLLQHGSRLTVQSLPGASLNPDSPLSMDLTVDGVTVTGAWTEQTAKDGYYKGARYHGAIQLLVDPTGRRLEGMWVGFGKDFSMNTGPWSLSFRTANRSRQSLAQFHRPPASDER
ncbi:XRE family transcriptional regulator [Streptomyces sp. S1D4-14]|uniref:helix-turn-helix domain-containing protein n=1 Tax=Streptomyces sp. S1D4-14 TaxID=2594461 RepID=UPI00116575AF|nr:XRE family transcriptional regulator [Streptomyces sp. S1D4-14]QDN64432.1 XRE family transcriptional regulator [Streptomyces sp. S1D4-14]